MDLDHVHTAADRDALAAALPPAPDGWLRDDHAGSVEYRLPDADGLCHAAKVTVRPDPLSEAAVRVDRTQHCSGAGTTRHDDVTTAAAAVERLLSPRGDSA